MVLITPIYLAMMSMLVVPRAGALYHAEPFLATSVANDLSSGEAMVVGFYAFCGGWTSTGSYPKNTGEWLRMVTHAT